MADEQTTPEVPSNEELLQLLKPQEQEAETPPPTETAPPESVSPPPPVEAPKEPPAEAQVPSWRLREESEARRAAEDRARQMETLLQQLEEHRRQQAAQQRGPDFYEDPERSVQEIATRVFQPYFERQHAANMTLSRSLAVKEYGAKEVDEASKAFLEAHQSGALPQGSLEYEEVVQNPHRYEALMQWHKRRSMAETVGSDPEAYFQRRLTELLAKPDFQAQLIEKLKGPAASRPSTVELPPSLSKVGQAAVAGADAGDLSDGSLWDYAKRH